MKAIHIATIAAVLGLAACSPAATEAPPLAEGIWAVDPAASKLSYVSIKADEIAEINRFDRLSGSVAEDGSATIEVDLASVSTGVDIRNERMREIFFNVAEFPTATITGTVDPALFANLAIGESTVQPLKATLSLKGVEAPIDTEVQVTRTAEDRVLAVSTAPVILDAGTLQLTDGLAQLQELAGLPSITPAVPVTFSLAFERQ